MKAEVCCLRIDSPLLPERLIPEYLTPPEIARGARFLRQEDRRRFTLGRALLRCLGARHLGIDPLEVRFAEGEYGKPLLELPSDGKGSALHFNLSHSGQCVVAAWSYDSPLGVDVEHGNRSLTSDLADIARTVFSGAERQVFSGVSDPGERVAVFYRIWVRKEAVIKAEGCGIGGALKSFSVVSMTGDGRSWADKVLYPESGMTWHLTDLETAENHPAALATRDRPTITLINPEELGLR